MSPGKTGLVRLPATAAASGRDTKRLEALFQGPVVTAAGPFFVAAYLGGELSAPRGLARRRKRAAHPRHAIARGQARRVAALLDQPLQLAVLHTDVLDEAIAARPLARSQPFPR